MELLRGVNFGGYLSQCEHSLKHYAEFIGEEDVKTTARWGFDHIRLPIDYEVLETEDGQIYEEGIAYVDRFLDWCRAAKLDVVLDLHKAPGYDFNEAGDSERNNLFTNEALKERFVTLWSRMAKRYGSREGVAFELLNEVVEEENAELWNELIDRAVKAIRADAPDIPIIYGGIHWNSAKTLKLLRVPEDKNVIFTFHFYEPLLFTHQKAYWVANMPKKDIPYPESMEYYRKESECLGYQGNDVVTAGADKMGIDFMEEMVKEAVDAAEHAGVRLYCGEFGVIDQAPTADTLRWFQDVMEVFGRHDIHSALWSYKEMDFGLADEHYAPIREEMIKLLTGK